ncbi:hypothetical protein EV714DRAFT_272734 [Schizophyllum commune]
MAGISGLTLVCYMAVHVLPLYKADCAYITPFTEHLYPALYVLQGWLDAKFHQQSAHDSVSSKDWASAFSLRAKQMEQARQDIDALAAESLIRLHAFSAHPSIPEIVTEVIAGLPGSSRTLSLLKRSRRLEEDAINHCVQLLFSGNPAADLQSLSVARLAYALLNPPMRSDLDRGAHDQARLLTDADEPTIENAVTVLRYLRRKAAPRPKLNMMLTYVEQVLRFVDSPGLPAFVWVDFGRLLRDMATGIAELQDSSFYLIFSRTREDCLTLIRTILSLISSLANHRDDSNSSSDGFLPPDAVLRAAKLLAPLKRLVTCPVVNSWRYAGHAFHKHEGLRILCQVAPVRFDGGTSPGLDDLTAIIRWYIDSSIRALSAENAVIHPPATCSACSRPSIVKPFAEVDALSSLLWLDGHTYIEQMNGNSDIGDDAGILRMINRLRAVNWGATPPLWPEDSSPLDFPVPLKSAWRQLALAFQATTPLHSANSSWRTYILSRLSFFLASRELNWKLSFSTLEDISSRDAEESGAIVGADAEHTDYAANNLLEIIDPDPGFTLRQLPYHPDSWTPEPIVEEVSTPTASVAETLSEDEERHERANALADRTDETAYQLLGVLDVVHRLRRHLHPSQL